MGMNVFDRNTGFAAETPQVVGFDRDTGIDSMTYGAPGARIFYVDPNNSQAVDFGNLGQDPTVPLATATAAVALCRDHRGDTIVIGPNDAWQYGPHNRTIAIVESLVIPNTKGGITIRGAATNPMGLQWEPGDDSEACITVHAIDVLIEGITFSAPNNTGATGIHVEWGTTAVDFGENLTVRGCFFNDLDYGITLDYSWYDQIYNNSFDTISIAAILNTSVTGDADYIAIHDNSFLSCALCISMPGSDENFIYNNRINEDGTGTNNFIDLTGGSTNLVTDNYFACTIAQYDTTCSDATSGAWLNNHCTNGNPAAPPT